MTIQDIAEIYGTTFQKVIQLIKKYKLNTNELRKVVNSLFMNILLTMRLFMLEVEFGIDAEGILIEEIRCIESS